MTANIRITTNAEGSFAFDLEDVRINGSLKDYLIDHLFDDDTGTLKDLPEESRELRQQALEETGSIIDSVDDDDEIADHFFSTTNDGINQFRLSEYSDVMDAIESKSHSADAVVAYLEWVGGMWSKEDFDATYEGEYPSDLEFGKSKLDLDDEGVPGHLQMYFDWERYTNDLMPDYHEEAGHYFSCG